MPLEKLEAHNESCRICLSDSNDELYFGPLFKLEDIVAHHFCLLFCSELEQNGTDEEGILGFLLKDIREGLKCIETNSCVYCSKPGASVKCFHRGCNKIFHFPCGLDNLSMHRFHGRFDSFCNVHRPKQRIPGTVLSLAIEEPPLCLVCYDAVDCSNKTDVIWATCCRHTWYHRECLQKLACSVGYTHFKCVYCRNRKNFLKISHNYGIYIPIRDASWELVPGAFRELYEKYERCDAPECLCPKGREYAGKNENWNLFVCCTCGAEGVHFRCGKVKGPDWECGECLRITTPREGNLSSTHQIVFKNDC